MGLVPFGGSKRAPAKHTQPNNRMPARETTATQRQDQRSSANPPVESDGFFAGATLGKMPGRVDAGLAAGGQEIAGAPESLTQHEPFDRKPPHRQSRRRPI